MVGCGELSGPETASGGDELAEGCTIRSAGSETVAGASTRPSANVATTNPAVVRATIAVVTVATVRNDLGSAMSESGAATAVVRVALDAARTSKA